MEAEVRPKPPNAGGAVVLGATSATAGATAAIGVPVVKLPPAGLAPKLPKAGGAEVVAAAWGAPNVSEEPPPLPNAGGAAEMAAGAPRPPAGFAPKDREDPVLPNAGGGADVVAGVPESHSYNSNLATV